MSERAVPILPSRDLAATLAFYEALGFENRGAPPDEWDYLILGRGSIELHFTLDVTVDPLQTAGSCYLFVEDAERLFETWKALVRPNTETGTRVERLVETDYGMKEFAVIDGSGNLIRVGTTISQARLEVSSRDT
jgi:catechol 2,3-dioxygenase-like lactoylglutathione lyase family enzyme